MPTINGVAIVYGTPDFSVTRTSLLGTMEMQDFDHEATDAVETIKTRAGKTCTRIYPDPGHKISLTGYVKGTGLANAKLQTLLPPIGTLVGLCFTSTEYVGVTSGLTWSIESAKLSGTNTSAQKLAVTLEYLDGITAAAS